jgi:hypothetical protein
MHKIFFPLVLAVLFFASTSFADQYVQGYTRKDGTYVQGYTRSSPNSSVRDNYSYKGNSNPYTRETGSSYYRNSPSSEYYGTSSSGSSGSGYYSSSYYGN